MSSFITTEHYCDQVSTIFKLKIENFLTHASRENPCARLDSDDFSLYKSRLRFYLSFVPTSRENDFKDFSSLFLIPENLDGEDVVYLKYKFWIENKEGKKIGDRRGKNLIAYYQ